MAQSFDVCVFGSCNVDYFTYVERQAKLGETIHAHGFLQGYGGKGANQCVMAAHLGARCAMVGKVGGDAAGADYRKQLESEGVDTSQLLSSSTAATGMVCRFLDQDNKMGGTASLGAATTNTTCGF
jgi:ribokinase